MDQNRCCQGFTYKSRDEPPRVKSKYGVKEQNELFQQLIYLENREHQETESLLKEITTGGSSVNAWPYQWRKSVKFSDAEKIAEYFCEFYEAVTLE